jgi:hypothetical protein
MFHKWRETTLREGARARGTIVDASQDALYARMGPASEPFEYKRTIQVKFPDGSTSETQESISLHTVQKLADRRTVDCWPQLAERTEIGATVPVRYDERDHSHIVLNLPALVEEILSPLDRSPDA